MRLSPSLHRPRSAVASSSSSSEPKEGSPPAPRGPSEPPPPPPSSRRQRSSHRMLIPPPNLVADGAPRPTRVASPPDWGRPRRSGRASAAPERSGGGVVGGGGGGGVVVGGGGGGGGGGPRGGGGGDAPGSSTGGSPGSSSPKGSPRASPRASPGSSSPKGSPGGSSSSPRFRPLVRTDSNPFLQKPLSMVRADSLPLLDPRSSSSSSRDAASAGGGFGSMGETAGVGWGGRAPPLPPTPPPPATKGSEFAEKPSARHHDHDGGGGRVERHLSLVDLIAVGVGGTLGTGFFVLCSLVSHSYAGPASIFSWTLSAAAAMLSGFCFAELAGQIPAAGSSYAYAYASMGELPAVVCAACLSLEYLVSSSAVARSWGDKMVDFLTEEIESGLWGRPSWLLSVLDPGYNFNPMAFLISAAVVGLLLGGVKESKAVTNYFTTFKVAFVVLLTLIGLTLMRPSNLSPFLPPEFGISGVIGGATSSFFGYLGFDEVCCLTAEAKDPQRNMPRAIIATIGIITACYVAGTVAITGMQPYGDISDVGGFPAAFEARGANWAADLAQVGEVVTLPLVVLVAVMAQPRLQYALARDGLLPEWFGSVDEHGNLWSGTVFAGGLMTAIASFVPFENLNDMISAGVLVAFCMTDSSLILLRHESPDGSPRLVEKLLTSFNVLSIVSGLLLSHLCVTPVGKAFTFVSCLATLLTCCLLKRWCPAAHYFGGRTRVTTQHTTIGVVSIDDEEFRTPFLPYVPCLGIFVNWYLVAQLSWSGLLSLLAFLVGSVVFYFSYGYHHSVGNNGGWDDLTAPDDYEYVAAVKEDEESGDTTAVGGEDGEPSYHLEKAISLPLMHHQDCEGSS